MTLTSDRLHEAFQRAAIDRERRRAALHEKRMVRARRLHRLWLFLLGQLTWPTKPSVTVAVDFGSMSFSVAKSRVDANGVRVIEDIKLHSFGPVLEVAPPLTDDQAAELKERWQAMFSPVHERAHEGGAEMLCGADGGRWAEHGPEVTCERCRTICHARLSKETTDADR